MWIDDGRLTIVDLGGMRIDAQDRVDSVAVGEPLAGQVVSTVYSARIFHGSLSMNRVVFSGLFNIVNLIVGRIKCLNPFHFLALFRYFFAIFFPKRSLEGY